MKLAKGIVAAVGVLAISAGIATADTLISKPPDFGPWWNPVGNNDSDTSVYADSWIQPVGPDNTATQLGCWLEPLGGAPNSSVRYEVWADAGGPNCNAVLASTAQFSTGTPGLNLHTRPVTSGGGPLVAGVKYWFVVTGVGPPGPASPYRVGGHTQNSVYIDNGTFWYSNDPAGCNFDGRNLTPEMAFQVLLTGPVAVEGTTWGRIKSSYK
jgi:hypothetical protein